MSDQIDQIQQPEQEYKTLSVEDLEGMSLQEYLGTMMISNMNMGIRLANITANTLPIIVKQYVLEIETIVNNLFYGYFTADDELINSQKRALTEWNETLEKEFQNAAEHGLKIKAASTSETLTVQ